MPKSLARHNANVPIPMDQSTTSRCWGTPTFLRCLTWGTVNLLCKQLVILSILVLAAMILIPPQGPPLPSFSMLPTRHVLDRIEWASQFLGRELRVGVGPACEDLAESHRTSHDVLQLFPGGFYSRDNIAAILEAITNGRKRGVGAELGVQQGLYAKSILSAWPSATEYHMIDPWVTQTNYIDAANVDQETQDARMASAAAVAQSFAPRVAVSVVRNFSYDAVNLYPDCYFDFVYVDAVHDYEGALNDMIDWWPKVRSGGLLAGHDMIDAIQHEPGGRSSIFGVKTAVEHFAIGVRRQVWNVAMQEGWPSFFIVK